MLHEISKIVDSIDHVRVLLNYVRKCLRVDESNGQLFIECVIIPIHFCQSENSGTCFVPTASTGESMQKQWGRCRLKRAFLVDVIVRIIDVNPKHAALGP